MMMMEDTSSNIPSHVLPTAAQLSHARDSLHHSLPDSGLGLPSLQSHLATDIVPALNHSSQSSRYFGFITGGATPASRYADNLVTEHDQNVQVHLPSETIATDLESAALDMVCGLLDLEPKDWTHRTFTTGATASNVVGLACGREYTITEAATLKGKAINVAEQGLMTAMRTADIDDIQILTTVPHSSIRKAASVLGLGHASVKDVCRSGLPHRFDLEALGAALRAPRTASIIMVSCAEVNTGFFATTGEEMRMIRSLADRYKAWLHVDAAFGLLARLLPATPEYATLLSGVSGLELADSITGDAHKLLNVPYDTGILLSRHLTIGERVFQNPGAPYLSSGASGVPSPLNIGIENSRRFRALPVYANLVAYGRSGYREMLQRQIGLARRIAAFVDSHPAYELLPSNGASREARHSDGRFNDVFIIVLFRAKDETLNDVLVKKINETKLVYASGTKWLGQPAARFAVSNWRVDVKRDGNIVKEVLETVVRT